MNTWEMHKWRSIYTSHMLGQNEGQGPPNDLLPGVTQGNQPENSHLLKPKTQSKGETSGGSGENDSLVRRTKRNRNLKGPMKVLLGCDALEGTRA